MEDIQYHRTVRFTFPMLAFPGWKLGSKLPNLYFHTDGSLHIFMGFPIVDQIRKTIGRDIEIIVTDYSRDGDFRSETKYHPIQSTKPRRPATSEEIQNTRVVLAPKHTADQMTESPDAGENEELLVCPDGRSCLLHLGRNGWYRTLI